MNAPAAVRGVLVPPLSSLALIASLMVSISAGWCRPVGAVTSTITIIGSPSNTDDSELREDSPSQNRGTNTSVRVRASEDHSNRNTIIRMPVTGLSGRTVLQAWLRLKQNAGSGTVPIDARIFPLTESFDEGVVTWDIRDLFLVLGTPWSTPGGTHSPSWADRVLLTTLGTNSTMQWQVGPIVQAWNTGALTNNGLLIQAERHGPNRDAAFNSSDQTGVGLQPTLVIQYTDQAPAIAVGTGEIQQSSVRTESKDAPLTVWLDVDALTTAPSGAPTGFDQLIVSHEGALRVTGVDSLRVNGTSVPASAVSFTDDGKAVTFRLPRVRIRGKVRLDFRADVLAPPTDDGVDLRMLVDDSATSGALAQALWPGNADGVAGNGDDWILGVVWTPAVAIDLRPDSGQIQRPACVALSVTGRDSLGNRFSVTPDSMAVRPPSAGTIGPDLSFCPLISGKALVIAIAGSLRDTSTFEVLPDRLTQIQSLVLRDHRGQVQKTFSPGDTMFVDATISDGDGLQDVQYLAFDVLHKSVNDPPNATQAAFGASFQWKRGAGQPWKLNQPQGTSWQILPAECVFDDASITTGSSLARLCFVAGRVARASNAGEWSARLRATSETPPYVADSTLAGLDVLPHLALQTIDSYGAFSAGPPGAMSLPLGVPADARLSLGLEANTPITFEAKASDFAGLTDPADTMRVTTPPRLHWSFGSNQTDGGTLSANWAPLETWPAPDDESALGARLSLWLDHPLGSVDQDYRGQMELRLSAPGFTSNTGSRSVQLQASVVSTGLAAQLALAEVVPHSVTAGTHGQVVLVEMLPFFQTGDTGIDAIRVGIPDSYGVPAVSQVLVAGNPVAYSDQSISGQAGVWLSNKVTTSQLVELTLRLDAPVDLDPAGSSFVVAFDDRSTVVTPQTATEGNADGQSNGNSWMVRVVPGPLARIDVSPAQAVMHRDSSATFTAVGSDTLGHPLAVTPAWRVEGGIGTIGASTGLFTATNPGTGRVIAQSGGFADTAAVTVLPPRAIAIRAVWGPSAVYQGQLGAALGVRIENSAPGAVTLDTLRLVFGRGVPGDADNEFTIVAVPPAPLVIAPVTKQSFAYSFDVAFDALAAPVAVTAVASGIEQGSGLRLRDTSPDTSLALNVLAGGVDLTASQNPRVVRPGTAANLLLTLRVVNHYPDVRTLEHLMITNRTSGPGDTDQLDAELGDVSLYRDDGDQVFEPAADTLVLRTLTLGGAVTFAPIDVRLAPLSTGTLFLAADLPRLMRDGDVLDAELAAAADALFQPAATFRNTWPAGATGGLTVDGMTAVQLTMHAVGPTTINPGAQDRLALDVSVPSNGYTPDVLTRLSVTNAGTAEPLTGIQRLRAWVDDGDGAFSPTADLLLGTLAYTGGGRWHLNGLGQPLPVGGKRVFVSVDAAATAIENTTIKLAVPAAPDPGLGTTSGDDGPLDVAVVNPGLLTVSDVDRVTFTALKAGGGTAHPGDRQLPLLQIAATNNYAASRTLTALIVNDLTTGPGTLAERDGEVRLLSLRADGNDDGKLDDLDVDPVLGTGFFQNGQVAFTGLSESIPAGKSRGWFVTADLSASAARDGDVIGAQVLAPSNAEFAEATSVGGTWPLDSEARWPVDGFVAAQVTNLGAPGATVGPGDGPLVVLDVIVPRNGYASDVLRGVRVTNLGTAAASDFSSVKLWRDGGDGVFSAADDVLLGPLTPSGADWASPVLAEPVGGQGLRLFVGVDIAGTPADTATVRFAIPVNGVEYESTNDGPLDAMVANAEVMLISSAPLLATLSVPSASTIGQTVPVSMVVRNVGTETVRGITPSTLGLTGTAPFTYVSGPAPATFDLAPEAADTLTWSYTADGVGDVRFAGSSGGTGDPSGLPRNAPFVTSNLHRVFVAAQHLDLTPVQTMPIRVNRGQTGIVPFSLTLVHPGGADASDVRVDRLTVRLEQESGAPIVPAALLSRVEVNEGTSVYLVKTALETSGSEVDLPLAAPVTVTGTQPATISIRLDIDTLTTVPTFRMVLDDSTRISARDATNGAPVVVRLQQGSYPLRSDVATVVAEATQLDVTALPPDTVRTSRGGHDATLLCFRLESPGVSGISSDVRVASMAVALTDSAGLDRVPPGVVVSELRLQAGSQVLARHTVTAVEGDTLVMTLTPPLELPANTPFDVALVGDIALTAPLGRLGARLADSSFVDVRDANSRVPLPALYTPAEVRGGVVIVESPADSMRARGTPSLPVVVAIGDVDVRALLATLRHPGSLGTARLRVDSLVLQCMDDLRRPLVPGTYLSRIHVLWNGADAADVVALPGTGDRVTVPLLSPLLEPGDSARVEVRIDVDAAAPAGFIELVVPLGELRVRDANTLTPATLVAEPGFDLPLHSGLARLALPARDLAVGLVSLMPAALAGDGRPVAVARLTLRNTDAQGVGPIDVDHLVVRSSDRAYAPQSLGAVATRIEAWRDGVLWAQSAALTPDSVTAFLGAAPQRLTIGAGATEPLELRIVTRTAATAPGVRIGLDRADIGVVQPGSALFAINVGPEPGLAFPLWTQSGVLSAADLQSSYVNFPNPFAAGREATTVAYFMPSPGRVTLRVLTPRGELVATLIDRAARAAGQQQSDRWDGRNGKGGVVLNGVYVAELEIHFDDGTSRLLRRKLAVVR
jgi:hypothetical protein